MPTETTESKEPLLPEVIIQQQATLIEQLKEDIAQLRKSLGLLCGPSIWAEN